MDHGKTRRIIRPFTHEVDATPEALFQLLCREYDWLPGWQCMLLYSDSGFAEPRCVFTTAGAGAERILRIPRWSWLGRRRLTDQAQRAGIDRSGSDHRSA